MVVRMWHGRVPAEKGDAYFAYLRRAGLADYAATAGNRGVHVLRRTENGVSHFLLTSYWESLEAIRAFAGLDMNERGTTRRTTNTCSSASRSSPHYEVLAASGILAA